MNIEHSIELYNEMMKTRKLNNTTWFFNGENPMRDIGRFLNDESLTEVELINVMRICRNWRLSTTIETFIYQVEQKLYELNSKCRVIDVEWFKLDIPILSEIEYEYKFDINLLFYPYSCRIDCEYKKRKNSKKVYTYHYTKISHSVLGLKWQYLEGVIVVLIQQKRFKEFEQLMKLVNRANQRDRIINRITDIFEQYNFNFKYPNQMLFRIFKNSYKNNSEYSNAVLFSKKRVDVLLHFIKYNQLYMICDFIGNWMHIPDAYNMSVNQIIKRGLFKRLLTEYELRVLYEPEKYVRCADDLIYFIEYLIDNTNITVDLNIFDVIFNKRYNQLEIISGVLRLKNEN